MNITDMFAFLALGAGIGFIIPLTGVGGLVSVPVLIFLGLSPQTAVAANRMGSVGVWSASAQRFGSTGKIVWKYVLPLSVIDVTGGIIGANLIVAMSEELLKTVIGVLTLLLVALMLLKKDLGLERRQVSRRREGAGYAMYFFMGIYRGFYGGGAGAVVNTILMSCMGLTMLEAKATRAIPGVLMAVAALCVFLFKGVVDIPVSLVFTAGMACGGWWGTHTALKKGDAWVKNVFMAAAVLMALKLLSE